MMASAITRRIIRELDKLPPELQRKVLDFTQALALSLPKGVPGEQLLRFAGVIEPDDAEAMSRAIEEGCERVDADAW